MKSDDHRRAIGKVTSVSADRFVIEMLAGTDNFTVVGFDDLHYVARLGSFLMIPAQSEYVVAEVVGLRERDVAGSGAGELDKANSAKYLDVVPVGMLPANGDGRFRFGVSVFPSLYADALYALDGELDRIFDTEADTVPGIGNGEADCIPAEATRFRNLGIGQSVVFEDYEVKIRIDDFFGGHVAVLGNTGSGKSCTVASILQSLFNKPNEHHARGATFVVLDVNGEYARAFERLPEASAIEVSRLVLDGSAVDGRFRLPHWYLDLSERGLLLQASERTQVPILRMALGLARLFGAANAGRLDEVRNHILARCITLILSDETPPGAKHTRIHGILQRFQTQQINPVTMRPKIILDYARAVAGDVGSKASYPVAAT